MWMQIFMQLQLCVCVYILTSFAGFFAFTATLFVRIGMKMFYQGTRLLNSRPIDRVHKAKLSTLINSASAPLNHGEFVQANLKQQNYRYCRIHT